MYKCNKCGNTHLEMIRETGTQYPVEINKKGRPIIDYSAVPKEHYKQYYQCSMCKEKLLDKNGKVISDHPEIKKWIKEQQETK